MLTEEKININFLNFIKILKKYNIYPEDMEKDDEFNEKLRNASAFLLVESGGAYNGSLIEHITKIALFAFKLNDMLHEDAKVQLESLIRVCYLHQISKCLTFVKNENDWEVKKGKIFTYAENLPAIKSGEMSIYLCNKYGIKLTDEEFEAILSVDKQNDEQTKYFSNSLSQILRASIDLANMERRIKFKNNK